jgi:hypothetical protein
MERRAGIAAAAIGALLIAAGLVGLGATLASGLLKFRQLERTVEVKGLAERDVPADLAIWTVAHVDADNDLSALHARLEAKNTKIVAFLKARGFDAGEIGAGAPSIADRLARDYGNEPAARARYSGRSTVTVYTPKVDAVRAATAQLGELARDGVAIAGEGEGAGARYVFTGLNAIKPAMIEEATRNARQTAEKFAADSSSTLGKIRRASQGQFSIEDRDRSTPHVKRVRVVSTVDYYLQD